MWQFDHPVNLQYDVFKANDYAFDLFINENVPKQKNHPNHTLLEAKFEWFKIDSIMANFYGKSYRESAKGNSQKVFKYIWPAYVNMHERTNAIHRLDIKIQITKPNHPLFVWLDRL